MVWPRRLFAALIVSCSAFQAGAQPPANDTPEGAIEITLPFTEEIDVAQATVGGGNPPEPPLSSAPASGEPHRTVWYHFANTTNETMRVRCDAASSEFRAYIEFFQDDPETAEIELNDVDVSGEVVLEQDLPGIDPDFNPLGSSAYIVFADFTEPPDGTILRFRVTLAAGDLVISVEQVADYLTGTLVLNGEQLVDTEDPQNTNDADANNDLAVDISDVVTKVNLRIPPP